MFLLNLIIIGTKLFISSPLVVDHTSLLIIFWIFNLKSKGLVGRPLKCKGFLNCHVLNLSFLVPLRRFIVVFVRLILEYGIIKWDSHTTSDRCQIECVSCTLLKFTVFKFNVHYPSHDYSTVLYYLEIPTGSMLRIFSWCLKHLFLYT